MVRKMEKKELPVMSGDIVNVNEDGGITEVEEGFLIISLKHPIKFENQQYDKIDLTCLYDIKAADMIAVNRKLNRNGNVDILQEMTMEYALNLAAVASGKPIEFFEQLPPYAVMQIKNRVTGFLYGRE